MSTKPKEDVDSLRNRASAMKAILTQTDEGKKLPKTIIAQLEKSYTLWNGDLMTNAEFKDALNLIEKDIRKQLLPALENKRQIEGFIEPVIEAQPVFDEE